MKSNCRNQNVTGDSFNIVSVAELKAIETAVMRITTAIVRANIKKMVLYCSCRVLWCLITGKNSALWKETSKYSSGVFDCRTSDTDERCETEVISPYP